MPRSPIVPAPPRLSAPDLPVRLEPGTGLDARGDHFQAHIATPADETDASYAEVTECRVGPASFSSLVLAGAVLVDVEFTDVRATVIRARGARLRRVRITGGRIGTLDLADAEIDELELRDVRIDYLSLAAARATDVVVSGCTLTTMDVPQARLSRIRFERTTADEVDTRALSAADVDLRGLEALSYTDVPSLRGATLTPEQIERLAPDFARSLGIDVRDDPLGHG